MRETPAPLVLYPELLKALAFSSSAPGWSSGQARCAWRYGTDANGRREHRRASCFTALPFNRAAPGDEAAKGASREDRKKNRYLQYGVEFKKKEIKRKRKKKPI